MRAVPFLAVMAGCYELPIDPGEPADQDWQPITYTDEGDLCFENQGADVAVVVHVQDCLSSSCSRNLDGSCEATVDGDTITLTSDVHWEENVGPEATCTDDCGAPTVSCTIPSLADGTYTVVHGTEEVELVVPVTGDCAQR